MAVIDEYCDSGGSDLELGESEEFEREVEVEGFVPDDPLDQAQEWYLWVEGEEEEDENDFAEFQVDWKTDGYLPRNPKQFTRKSGLKQPIAVVETVTPLDVLSKIFTDEL